MTTKPSIAGRLPSVLAIVAAIWMATPASASAELVFFASGRSLSVRSYRLEGPSIVLVLRTGGEIVCDRTIIVRIEPDEVPYPEPVPEPAPTAAAAVGNPTVTTQAPAGPLASVPYAEIIDTMASTHGVDPGLVRALIQVESAYHPRARSRKGAMGLMQLMPGTARQYAVKDPYDPKSNIEAGVKHLRTLLDRFEIGLALAAYNAGEAAVLKFRGIPPYRETRNYVTRVLDLSRGMRSGT